MEMVTSVRRVLMLLMMVSQLDLAIITSISTSLGAWVAMQIQLAKKEFSAQHIQLVEMDEVGDVRMHCPLTAPRKRTIIRISKG